MSCFRRAGTLLLLIAFVICSPARATATPITYTFSGDIDGSIGNTNFTNEGFSIVVDSDTSSLTSSTPIPGGPTVITTPPNQPASLILAGIGMATITDGATVNLTESEVALVVTNSPSGTGTLGIGNPVFSTYDLASSIGPVPGGVGTLLTYFAPSTSLGIFQIIEFDGNNPSFTAQLEGSAVPEPSSLVMGLIGLTLVVAPAALKRLRPIEVPARIV